MVAFPAKKTVRLVFRLYSWAIFVWVFQILPLEKDKGSFPSLDRRTSSSGCPFPRHSPSSPPEKAIFIYLLPRGARICIFGPATHGANSLPLRHATVSVCTYIRPLVACSCFFISATRGETRDVCKMKKGMHESLGDVWLIPPLPGK